MMRKLTSLVIAMTLAMGTVNIVYAAADNITPPPAGTDKPMMHKPLRQNGLHNMFKGLNLTDAQKQQMCTIMKDAYKGVKHPSLEERRTLHSIIASDSFDPVKAEEQAGKKAANGNDRVFNMIETQNKMYNVLTPEQKKQFNQNFEERLTKKPHHEGQMVPADD